MLLTAYLLDRYAPTRRNFSDGTREQMLNAISRWQADVSSPLTVSNLNEIDIGRHINSLLACGRSPATANVRQGYFVSLWRHAYRRGLTTENPFTAELPRAREYHRKPRAWSVEELRMMLAEADRVNTNRRHPFGPKCWRALILLLYYSGLRIGVTLQLRRSSLHGHVLLVPPEIQKDDEEMVFRLPQELTSLLVSLPRPEEERHGRQLQEMLLPWPWSFHDPQDKLKRYILGPAGLPTNDRKMKFHAIRKSVATIVSAHRGKEAAREIMGHSSMSVTERYLADPSTVDPSLPSKLSPMDVLPPLGNCG